MIRNDSPVLILDPLDPIAIVPPRRRSINEPEDVLCTRNKNFDLCLVFRIVTGSGDDTDEIVAFELRIPFIPFRRKDLLIDLQNIARIVLHIIFSDCKLKAAPPS